MNQTSNSEMPEEMASPKDLSERAAGLYARSPASSVAVAPQSRPAHDQPESRAPGPQLVELHVEEMMLDGFEPAQRYAFGEAFESELGRLFAERGVPAGLIQDIEIAHLNGGEINLAPGAPADDAGIRLARTIYGGFDR